MSQPAVHFGSQMSPARPSKKSRFGPKRNVVARKPRVPRNLTMVDLGKGFPKQLKLTHRYTVNNSWTSTLGALDIEHYACNGMYDPTAAAGGGQPMFFDQVGDIYNHYVVTNAKITIKVSGAATNSLPAVFGIYINDDTGANPSTARGCIEQSQAVWKLIGPGAQDQVVISKTWNASETFGNPLAQDELQGTTSANPTELAYFSCFFQTADVATTSVLYGFVEIEYTAVWRELIDMVQS